MVLSLLTMPPKTQSKYLKEISNSIQECLSAIEEISHHLRLNRHTVQQRKPLQKTCHMPQHRRAPILTSPSATSHRAHQVRRRNNARAPTIVTPDAASLRAC